jgi:hypothetical protein
MHFFITNAFSPIQYICAIIILSLSKKNKEEGNSLVGYRRYCYATALRDVCNLIILESLSFVFNDKRQAKKNFTL